MDPQAERSLQSLLQDNLPRLEAYVRLHAGGPLRRREETVDLVQSVCREVLADEEAFQFEGEKQFRSWLYKHALHKIVNRARHYGAARRDVARESPAETGSGVDVLGQIHATLCSPSEHAVGIEAAQSLESAMERLTEEQREAVVLRRVLDLDYDEIAEQMGKKATAVRVLVHRGVARLAILLDQSESSGG